MTTSPSEESNDVSTTPAAPQLNVGSTALKGIFGKKSASKKKFKTTNLNTDRQKAESKKKEELGVIKNLNSSLEVNRIVGRAV
ncbi:hypothetical protein FOZ63_021587 [Perkinsus olseni]|uniref:Uncharacterized protein n=1 Tax=Perkinsus olseni TaxID=32597 RepID=A0A7J6NLG7_PEROL|nr:hypothetical protein FOZ63_021587 [Perkinsus olseni]